MAGERSQNEAHVHLDGATCSHMTSHDEVLIHSAADCLEVVSVLHDKGV